MKCSGEIRWKSCGFGMGEKLQQLWLIYEPDPSGLGIIERKEWRDVPRVPKERTNT